MGSLLISPDQSRMILLSTLLLLFSLADMTGAPHSNHTTIEEEDPLIPCSSGSITTNNNNISNSNNNINNVCRQQSQQEEQSPQPQSSPQVDNQQQCCVPSPRRGSRHNITEVILPKIFLDALNFQTAFFQICYIYLIPTGFVYTRFFNNFTDIPNGTQALCDRHWEGTHFFIIN